MFEPADGDIVRNLIVVYGGKQAFFLSEDQGLLAGPGHVGPVEEKQVFIYGKTVDPGQFREGRVRFFVEHGKADIMF